jgi:hypothetical protein
MADGRPGLRVTRTPSAPPSILDWLTGRGRSVAVDYSGGETVATWPKSWNMPAAQGADKDLGSLTHADVSRKAHWLLPCSGLAMTRHGQRFGPCIRRKLQAEVARLQVFAIVRHVRFSFSRSLALL